MTVMNTFDIDASLGSIIGGKTARSLDETFGIRTVGDLLSHYPRRYVDPGGMSDLTALTTGDHVSVLAEVVSSKLHRPGGERSRKSRVEVVISDGSGTLTLVFFNQPGRKNQCAVGRKGLFEGVVSSFQGRRQLTHPRLLMLPSDPSDPDYAEAVELFTDRLIPIYPASKAMPTWKISQAVGYVLKELRAHPELNDSIDPLPVEIRQLRGLMDLTEAWQAIHLPTDLEQVNRAEERLRFDEAFTLQTVLAQRRERLRAVTATPRHRRDRGVLAAFDTQNPFTLTEAQMRVGDEIFTDLGAGHPMHRLLQGDVGSGKTLVALRAMLAVVDSGAQAALLAPTEVLAQQHFHTLQQLLGPLARGGMLDGTDNATSISLVTGSQGVRARRKALQDLSSGTSGIVVGTHALLEDTVAFAELGLVVIDEQHRFGVEQRSVLAQPLADGTRPHVLVMTATPIPRTVAMTVFGDLDVSVLDQSPEGRQPIATHVVAPREKPRFLARAWERIREEVAAGHKVYVVCPRIGDSHAGPPDAEEATDAGDVDTQEVGAHETSTMASVLDVVADLRETLLPGLRVGMLHGRLPAEVKEQMMRDFAAPADDPSAVDVLVATTVIEVGVDVPDATVMVILDADRFGISQLHQLRGRVGRGSAPSLCLLVTSAEPGSPGRERLEAVASTTDGFALARVDLQARREGDVLGALQSGRRSSLRLLQVLRDEDLVIAAREEASALVSADPDLREHRRLRSAVARLLDDDRTDYLDKG